MKANYIALVLSLGVINLPVISYADTKQPVPTPQTVIAQKPKINLNKVDVQTLTGSFKGIGKKRAEAIIAYREAHSGIKSLEEFAEIRGFGQRFVEKNRESLAEVFVLG